MIANISAFNTNCLLPFIVGFFTSTVGFTFVGTVVLVVVLAALAKLLRSRY